MDDEVQMVEDCEDCKNYDLSLVTPVTTACKTKHTYKHGECPDFERKEESQDG